MHAPCTPAFCQTKHNELHEKFLEERKALEAKYLKLYEPIYTEVNTCAAVVARHNVQRARTLRFARVVVV